MNLTNQPKENNMDSASNVQQKVQIVVEKPSGFEKRSTFAILVMPLAGSLILWTMMKKGVYKLFGLGTPSTNSLWFDGLGKKSRELKDHQASWRAPGPPMP